MSISSDKSAFTLVEVLIGVFVFALVASGIAAATLLSSRIATANVYSNTAHSIVQAYAEQIKSLDFATIKNAYLDPGENSIPTMGLNIGGTEMERTDPLTFGVKSQKTVVVDVDERSDGTFSEKSMLLWITPSGRYLNDVGEADQMEVVEITLEYDWQTFGGSSDRISHGNVKLVKSNVSK